MSRRRTHRAHRFRVISRCPACAVPLLSGCAYRSRSGLCIATRDERPIGKAGYRRHPCRRVERVFGNRVTRTHTVYDRPVGSTIAVDLTREARRIFGDVIAPGVPLDLQ